MKTGIAGLYLKSKVKDKDVDLIIDTGSSVTILASSIFKKINQQNQFQLTEFPSKLYLADGSELPVLGMTRLSFRFDDFEINHETLIADIESDGLIGLDFIKTKNCEINYGQKTFVIEGHRLEFKEEFNQCKSCRIFSSKMVTIPPYSEYVVQGRVENSKRSGNCSITEPVQSIQRSHGLVPGRMLVNPSKGIVPVCIANPSDEPVVLPKGTVLAIAVPTLDVRAFEKTLSNSINHITSEKWDANIDVEKPSLDEIIQGPLPFHLQDLLDRSSSDFSEEQYVKTRNFLWHYSYVFSSGGNDIGRCDITEHKIPTGDHKPVKLPPRQIPIHLREAVDKELDKLLDMGIIQPSASPWSSCIVVVRKPDGSIRLCLDVRAVNARTKHDSYPLPRTDTCLQSMHGSTYFSTLDLYSGFNQILLDKQDACKTSFSTARGSFQYVTLPFGLQGGPATCQRLMNTIMTGHPLDKRLVIYMDDLITHAPSFDDALEALAEVAFRLLKANLKVKTSKCILFQKSVSFLGHKVSADGIATCPEKIEKVKEWPSPKNITEVKGFLGLCSYYKDFLKDYGETAYPLHKLSQKDIPFEWTQECQDAFDSLKQSLCSSPILAFPNETDTFIVDTDASLHSIGAVLSQVQDGVERVIAYGSKVLSKQQRNYCTTRRELLAIVHFVPKWRQFLLARKFLLRSDHGSLYWLFNWRNPEGQIARWHEILGEFEFEIEHRSGKKHANADALSRIPCAQCGMGVESDENDKSEDLKLKAKRILEKTKAFKSRNFKMKSKEKGNEKNAESLETQSKNVVNQTQQMPVNDHTYCAPNAPDIGPDLEETDTSSNEESDQQGDQNWLQGYTPEELCEMQKEDSNIGFILNKFLKNEPKPSWDEVAPLNLAIKSLWSNWERLELSNNVLYRKFQKEKQVDPILQLILPQRLKNTVLAALHDGPQACHLGEDKTIGAVQSRVYFYGYKKYVSEWLRKCHICNSKKPSPNIKKAPLKNVVFGAPLEQVSLDIAGPFPISDNNRYILVIGDAFTKFFVAIGLPDTKAETVANSLVKEWILKFGTPRIIHSDRGVQFTSAVFKQMCKLLGIHQTLNSSYHARGNGKIERMNGTIERLLAMTIRENQSDWSHKLPYVVAAYHATPHKSTGLTPNQLMFGREVVMPIDLMIGQPKDINPITYGEYNERQRETIEKAFKIARKGLEKAAITQKKNYDVNVKGSKLDIGSRVWCYFPPTKLKLSSKLTRKWQGPFIIVDKLGDLNYKIQLNPRCKIKVVHRDRLNAYQGPNCVPNPPIQRV